MRLRLESQISPLPESSINSHYTFQYSQPSEYRFSHDSVFMARRTFEVLAETDLTGWRALDLCAGCGVIGLDFLFHRRQAGMSLPLTFDFMDVQEVYRQHFSENIKHLADTPVAMRFLNQNYLELQSEGFKYDLILANPPYFEVGNGKLSPSEFKNRCRFFIDADLRGLLTGIASSLTARGQAFLILRDQPEHGRDVVREVKESCEGQLRVSVLGDVRGARFIRLGRDIF